MLRYIMLSFILILWSCSEGTEIVDPIIECNDENVSYAEDITPIFKSACAISGCHVNNFSWGNFNEYAEIKFRIQFIQENVFDFGTMPPPETNGPKELTKDQLELLDCWITLGAQDN